MSIAVATYVDNQAIVKYPLYYITTMWDWADELYWFASDNENAKVFKSEYSLLPEDLKRKLKIIVLDHKITSPDQICIAQNKSIQWMKENCKTDYLAFQQADLIITPHGIGIINDWLSQKPCRPIAFAALQNKLFVELLDNPFGVVIMNHDFNYKAVPGWFVNDGGTNESIKSLYGIRKMSSSFSDDPSLNSWSLDVITKNERIMMDLGYFDIDSYYRKLTNHIRLWPDKEWKTKMKELFDRSKEDGIKAAFERISQHEETGGKFKVVPYEGQYKWLIEKINVQEDYQLVKKIWSKIFG
jgi:hypothetical protein